jgi:hypothetical protein
MAAPQVGKPTGNANTGIHYLDTDDGSNEVMWWTHHGIFGLSLVVVPYHDGDL